MPDATAAPEIAHAEAAARAAPGDPQAWLAWAAALARGHRFADEGRVLEQALERHPTHATLLLASGQNALRCGQPALAIVRLTLAAEHNPASPLPWIGLSSIARHQGDLPLALARHREAVRRDARYGPDLAVLAQALAEQGHAAEAADVAREAALSRPAAVAAWREAAIRLGNAGHLAPALDAARRGAALAPDDARANALVGELLRLSGDTINAEAAYAAATRLAPGSADYWNKIGCLQRENRNLRAAEASLRRALAADPAYGIARENLVTLVLGAGRIEDGVSLLREAAAMSGLPDAARVDARQRMAILDEHAALAPAVAAAVAAEHDGPLLAALAGRAIGAAGRDARLLDFLATLARAAAAHDVPPARAAIAPWAAWPAIEAHVSLHLDEGADALAATVRQVAAFAATDAAAAPAHRIPEVVRFARAVSLRQALPPPAPVADAQEARLRFWHAMLTWEQPLLFPGQVKPFPIVVESNPDTPRTPPAQTVGTWRELFTHVLPLAPAGPCRAALLYLGLVDCHGFRDGNGRLARFLANGELERAGWPPIVFTKATTRSLAAALAGVRYTASLDPMLALFERAAADTGTWLAARGQAAAGPR